MHTIGQHGQHKHLSLAREEGIRQNEVPDRISEVPDPCLVMSFLLKVCIYSHTRGVKLGIGLGFMQTSQVLPH